MERNLLDRYKAPESSLPDSYMMVLHMVCAMVVKMFTRLPVATLKR